MHIHTVHIDGHTFILTADQDIEALKGRIVSALQPGGGFVEFESVGRGQVSVLITPNLPVRIESIERSEEQMADWEQHPPAIEDSQNFDTDFFDQFI